MLTMKVLISRIFQLFEIIVEFPESLPAIEDLKVITESYCLQFGFTCLAFINKSSDKYITNYEHVVLIKVFSFHLIYIYRNVWKRLKQESF